MVARQDPGFIGNARGIGTDGQIVAARLDDPQRLPLLLLDDVAEDAALLADEILATGAQFVEYAPRDEHGRSNL